jgi:hypothetical protein
MSNKNSITRAIELSADIKHWLLLQFQKPIPTNKILKEMKESFKWTKDFPLAELESYRLSITPDYKKTLPSIENDISKIQEEVKVEAEIYEAVAESMVDSEDDFSKDERKKLNMLKSHRKILKELWNNYNAIRGYDDEMSKVKYLDSMTKELQVISQFEASERDFLSAMSEIRKAEEKMTLEQNLDSIMSWWIPRMAEKGKSKNEILEGIFKLQLMLNFYSRLIMQEDDTDHANRELLEALYGQREVKRIEN